MTRITRIVCAVDVEDSARTAFEQALAIARARDARLLLVCAVPPGRPFSHGATERVAYLTRIRREAEAAGVAVYAAVQIGETAEIILLHARSRQADLIVIGAGHGRAHGHSWGLVAEDVLRSAPCPTLIVPAGASNRPSFANVLCAVDLAPHPDVPLTEVLPLVDAREHRLTVLHVVGGEKAETGALQALQEATPAHTRGRTFARVAIGAVEEEVMRAVRSLRCDLLVIGARPRTRIGRRLFGVTRALLGSAPCPVLAIPATAATARLAA